MITFDRGDLPSLIKRRAEYKNVNFILIAILAVLAIVTAVLSGRADISTPDAAWTSYIVFLTVTLCLAVALIAFNLIFVIRAGGRVKYAVAQTVAEAFYSREQTLLRGDATAKFTVKYAGVTLSVLREGREDDPLEFDLSALRVLPSVYAATGTQIWAFMHGYYAHNAQKCGYDSVTVTDGTGKKPLELEILKGGVPCGNTDKNYFLKKGLIK